MAHGAQPLLTPAQMQELQAAHQLLRQGRASDAAALVRRVSNDAPWSADAHHLLAMCLADAGDVAAAEASFLQALDRSPRRVIRPKPGYLALFPSYMWHGTVPFSDTEPRMTSAFDMLPKPLA